MNDVVKLRNINGVLKELLTDAEYAYGDTRLVKNLKDIPFYLEELAKEMENKQLYCEIPA